MERKKSELLSAVLLRYLRESGLESPLNQYRLVQAWADVAGEAVAAQTRELAIRNQTLVVKIASPALRANLMMRRRQLVQHLTQTVRAEVITDIAFY